jgi:hypothetical protein
MRARSKFNVDTIVVGFILTSSGTQNSKLGEKEKWKERDKSLTGSSMFYS